MIEVGNGVALTAIESVKKELPNKTLHTNRRPALGFGLSTRLFDTCRCHHVIVRAAVAELGSAARAPRASQFIHAGGAFCMQPVTNKTIASVVPARKARIA